MIYEIGTETADRDPARPTTPEQARGLFPALSRLTYLSVCDKAILADPVRAAVEHFLDRMASGTTNRVQHEGLVDAARAKFARLVNARPAEISVTRNVSDGVNAIAGAFPFREGDNLVICTGAEHPNNIYPWLRLGRLGVEVRAVPTRDGRIDTAAMREAMDRRTRLVTAASVSFSPGYRSDLAGLGEHCARHDAFFLVDGVQSAGILHHDFAVEPLGGFATSTSKGLLGIYGFGFLYVDPKWLDRLVPAFLSRTGVDIGTDDASAMGGTEYCLHADGRRFELGSYNLAGAYAADASLSLLLSVGTRTIERHVLDLAARLRDGLRSLGLEASQPRHRGEESHIVTCGRLDGGGHGYSDDPAIERLYRRLTDSGVVLTLRRGQLRFGLHLYNSTADIERVLDLCG